MAIDDCWQPYLDKMKELSDAVKLTAFWTEETAARTNEAALNAIRVAELVKSIANHFR